MLQRIENYCKAVERLREALSEFANNPNSTVIWDGVIHRFKFTFELAWKSLREYLEDQGADMSGDRFLQAGIRGCLRCADHQ